MSEYRKRRQLEEIAARRRRMQEMCKQFNEQPIIEMTDAQTTKLAIRIGEEAVKTLRIFDKKQFRNERRMSLEESAQYTAVILSSIRYFNDNSKEHKRIMQYQEECRKAAEEAQRKIEERRKRSKDLIISII